MANKRISELTAATGKTGDELLEFVQSGTNKKITVDLLLELTPNEKTTDFALATTDRDTLIILNNPAAITIDLSDFSAATESMQFVFYRKEGTDTVTFDANGQTLEYTTLTIDEKGYSYLYYNKDANEFYLSGATGGGGSGTVTSVSFTGGLISVANPTTTPAFTVAGTSGGIPYFSSGSTWASSAALAANALVIGGGAGVAPSTTTTGTGVLTALGINVESAGAFVVNGGPLGTPSGGTISTGVTLGLVTMTLGSDGDNDMYYRNSSGVLTRLANGTTGQVLTATTGSPPSWSSTGGSFWPLTGSATLTGAVTITSNDNDQLNFTGTWTAGANNEAFANLSAGTYTARATTSDTLIGLKTSHTLVAGANSQVLVGTELRTTFTPGLFTPLSQILLRLRNGSGTNGFDFINNGTAAFFDVNASSSLTFRFNSTTLYSVTSTNAITFLSGVAQSGSAVSMTPTLAVASGSNDIRAFVVNPVINVTGTFAGTTTGIQIAATETSLNSRPYYDLVSASTTAKTGFGLSAPTARLHVRGASNTTAFIAEEDGGGAIINAGESGGARVIGFFGVTPVIRQVVATGSTTDNVITALQNLGLFSQT